VLYDRSHGLRWLRRDPAIELQVFMVDVGHFVAEGVTLLRIGLHLLLQSLDVLSVEPIFLQ
jgi:hypothetical protein